MSYKANRDAKEASLDHAYLLSRLHYSPSLGLFWWKEKDGSGNRDKQWNASFAGKIAGTFNDDGYVVISIERRNFFAHRLAWFYANGVWPADEIDHINRIRADNAVRNLREATSSQNKWNARHQSKHGLSGVYKDKNRWRSQAIRMNGQRFNMKGSYATPEEAHAVYAARVRELRGEFAA